MSVGSNGGEQAGQSKSDMGTSKDSVTHQVAASVKGEDAPMSEQHPTAPGALVMFTYPAILIIVLLLGFLLFAMFSNQPN